MTSAPKSTLKVHLIAAARPNFMKVAPAYHALSKRGWCEPYLVHTGQHYDAKMSDTFFQDLGLPQPHFHLGVGSGTHAEQTGGVMVAYEKTCVDHRPDWVIVVGDVNSTLACTLTAKKLHLPVAHLEAGLRSNDRTMPEEINRLATDAIADLLWTPSPDADENLLREGVPGSKIDRIGNIMIDSFEMMRPQIEASSSRQGFGVPANGYAVVTLHRPANVDDPETLDRLVATLCETADSLPVIFAVHPRTRGQLEKTGLMSRLAEKGDVHLTEPLGYVDFMSLVRECRLVLTDSGGIQEETTYLGIPCLTLRDTTERPITITHGTNKLVSPETVGKHIQAVISGDWRTGDKPDRWDGRTAERLADSLREKAWQ